MGPRLEQKIVRCSCVIRLPPEKPPSTPPIDGHPRLRLPLLREIRWQAEPGFLNCLPFTPANFCSSPTPHMTPAENLDAHLRSIMTWHFSPETGCPFWLDWAKTAGWDPR